MKKRCEERTAFFTPFFILPVRRGTGRIFMQAVYRSREYFAEETVNLRKYNFEETVNSANCNIEVEIPLKRHIHPVSAACHSASNGMIEHCCLYYPNSIQLMISQEPRKGLFQLFTDHQ